MYPKKSRCVWRHQEQISVLQKSTQEVKRSPLIPAQLHYGCKPIKSCYNFVLHYVDRASTGEIEKDARVWSEFGWTE